MGFKEVTSLDTDHTTALGGINKKTGKSNPTSAEGYYLGSKKVESKKARSGFAYLHILQTPKGNLGIWGKTDLDRKILSVPPGSMVRVTHTGMLTTPNGDMYKFKVEVDSDNTIEVSASAEDHSVGVSEETWSNDDENSDSIEQDSSGDDDYGQAVLAAAERKAKVEALLKGPLSKSNSK